MDDRDDRTGGQMNTVTDGDRFAAQIILSFAAIGVVAVVRMLLLLRPRDRF